MLFSVLVGVFRLLDVYFLIKFFYVREKLLVANFCPCQNQRYDDKDGYVFFHGVPHCCDLGGNVTCLNHFVRVFRGLS